MRYIISGGGTGGHIFPALAIADAIVKLDSEAKILFVGAENRMEMQVVPENGYEIEGLPIAGFNRRNILKNFSVLFKLYKSMNKAKSLVKKFNPDIAIGVGGYASGPILKVAQKKGIPTIIQEQNSYAGVTNKLLARNANAICVAYENMERFFPKEKIRITGNPLRPTVTQALKTNKKSAKELLGFPSDKPLVVVVGGSLGAKTINDAVRNSLDIIKRTGASLLWQTGKRFFADFESLSKETKESGIIITPFIKDMGLVYAAADILISRAGASTISEIQFSGTPSILIPSPNVAEDHQRRNAEALSDKGAAITIIDDKAKEELPMVLEELLLDTKRRANIGANVKKMGIADSDIAIAAIAIDLAKEKKN